MNDGAALGLVLDQVSKDKNIDRPVLVETLEQAILTAAKRAFGLHREMEAKFNEASGRVDLFQICKVVPVVAVPGNEMTLEDAHRFDPEAMLQTLLDEGVSFLVVGGVAAGLYGSERPTFDLDVLPEPGIDNARKLARAERSETAPLLPPPRSADHSSVSTPHPAPPRRFL